MSNETANPATTSASKTADEPLRVLTPAAERALREAEERRARKADMQRREATVAVAVAELGGRKGPDPVRYGDWENGGIASDF